VSSLHLGLVPHWLRLHLTAGAEFAARLAYDDATVWTTPPRLRFPGLGDWLATVPTEVQRASLTPTPPQVDADRARVGVVTSRVGPVAPAYGRWT